MNLPSPARIKSLNPPPTKNEDGSCSAGVDQLTRSECSPDYFLKRWTREGRATHVKFRTYHIQQIQYTFPAKCSSKQTLGKEQQVNLFRNADIYIGSNKAEKFTSPVPALRNCLTVQKSSLRLLTSSLLGADWFLIHPSSPFPTFCPFRHPPSDSCL